MHNLLEILIFILRNFTKLPILRYLGICSVLHIWHIRAIPTYRVYRLYDYIIQLSLKRPPQQLSKYDGTITHVGWRNDHDHIQDVSSTSIPHYRFLHYNYVDGCTMKCMHTYVRLNGPNMFGPFNRTYLLLQDALYTASEYSECIINNCHKFLAEAIVENFHYPLAPLKS